MSKTVMYISIGAVVAMLAMGGGIYAWHSEGGGDRGTEESAAVVYTYNLAELHSLEVQVLYGELSSKCDTLIVKTSEKGIYYSSFYIDEYGRMCGFKYNSHVDMVVSTDPYRLEGVKNTHTGGYEIQIVKGSTRALVTELSFQSIDEPSVLPK